MKRYLLFAGDSYYPCGGMNDFEGDFDTIPECIVKLREIRLGYDWHHVLDIVTGKWDRVDVFFNDCKNPSL